MPRKKAEPEVLQEETVQPETTDIEETFIAEQPALEPKVEEPETSEPVQPHGEEDVPTAEEQTESSEPEKKSFYDLDFRMQEKEAWGEVVYEYGALSKNVLIDLVDEAYGYFYGNTNQYDSKRIQDRYRLKGLKL